MFERKGSGDHEKPKYAFNPWPQKRSVSPSKMFNLKLKDEKLEDLTFWGNVKTK